MSKSISVLFQLLRISLGGCKESLPSAVNWQEVMDIAANQNVIALAFDALETLPEDQRPDMDTLMDWLGQASYVESIYEDQQKASTEFAELLQKNGIEGYVLKGSSVGVLYPKPSHRYSGDLDVYCEKDGVCANVIVNELIESLGIEVNKQYYKDFHFHYKNLLIENHKHLLPTKSNKNAQILENWLFERMKPEAPKHLIGTSLFSPSPLFLAVHMLAHAHEHFFEESINLRYVADWVMILKANNAAGEIFWTEWKNICEKSHILSFGYAMSNIAKRVCGIEIPFECPSNKIAEQKLLEDIFTPKQIESPNKFYRRIELIGNIFRGGWKFRYFSDTNALAFACGRVWGYLFEKE